MFTFTGIVRKKGAIDRETNDTVVLEIVATDNGVPSRNSSVKLHVDVLDFNDNAPTFVNTPYSQHVQENATEGQHVINVSAVDKDEGVNSLVTYSFKSGDFGNFSINGTTVKCLCIKSF